MSFRILNDAVINALTAVSLIKIPVVGTLPIVTVGGQFIGLTTATGVDLYYYDGDTWFKLVDSSAAGGGLPNVLAINNNSGGVNNIILDNLAGAGVGALSSDSGDDLNLFAGAVNTSAPSAGTEDLRLASGTGAGAMVNIDGGLGGVDIDATGPLTSDTTTFSIDGSSTTAPSNVTHVGAPGFDLTVNSTAGSLNLIGGEADPAAVTISALTAGGGIDMNSATGGFTLDTTGGMSLDSTSVTAPSNINTVGAPGVDLTLGSASGSLILSSGEAASDAIQLLPTAAAGDVQVGSGAADTTSLLVPDGILTAPAIAFISDPDTGIYINAAGDLAVIDDDEEVASFALGGSGLIVGAAATPSAHITSSQTAVPGVVGNAQVAGTPAIALLGSDLAGGVTFTTVGAPAAAATATVTYNRAFGAAPHVVIAPSTATGALVDILFVSSITTTTFVVSTSGTPTAATAFGFEYHVIG